MPAPPRGTDETLPPEESEDEPRTVDEPGPDADGGVGDGDETDGEAPR